MKKTVLITGGAGGIGVACARRLAGGYNLIILSAENLRFPEEGSSYRLQQKPGTRS